MERGRVKIKARDIAELGMMIAVIEAAKLQLSFLPNVELVSLLIILFTLYAGPKVLYAIAGFVLLEGCIYGFGIWWIMYIYVWPILAGLTWLMRKNQTTLPFAILSGAFGLGFGAMCSIPYLFVGGVNMAFSWWVAGIPYDILHGVSNLILCLLLFKPLNRALKRLKQGTGRE